MIATGFFTLLVSLAGAQDRPPPPTFVDKGACPRECCKYGKWKAEKSFDVFEAIDMKKKIAAVKAGEMFTGVFGEVHTAPYEVKMMMDDEKIKAGETVHLLTYMGEGFYRVWRKGKVEQVFEGATDREKREKLKPRRSAWYVQVRLEDGRTGWMREAGQFDPYDCKKKK